MTEYSGATDPDRILPLLWRHKNARKATTGRPPRLSVDQVVAAGIAVADEEGLAAASMARVAARLGVATMTLYTYVPSRAELAELMVDEVLGSRRLPGPGEAGRRTGATRSSCTPTAPSPCTGTIRGCARCPGCARRWGRERCGRASMCCPRSAACLRPAATRPP